MGKNQQKALRSLKEQNKETFDDEQSGLRYIAAARARHRTAVKLRRAEV